MKHTYFFIFFLFCFCFSGFSQPSLAKMKAKVTAADNTATNPKMELLSPSQGHVLFSDSRLPEGQVQEWLANQLELRQGIDVLSEEAVTNTGELKVQKLHQYFKGLKVEHGVINTTSHNSKTAMMQMEFYSISDNFKTTALLNEQAALQAAIDFTAAKRYAWTDYTGNDPEYMLPHGELVILPTYRQEGEVCLAYKFKITALYPVSKAWVYVNAWDRSIVLNNPIIKHATRNETATTDGTKNSISDNEYKAAYNKAHNANANFISAKSPIHIDNCRDENLLKENKISSNVPATAATRFMGTQSITTDNSSTVPGKPYRLREWRNLQNIITLNYQGNPYNTTNNFDLQAVDFADNDNNWTAAEYHGDYNFDDAALDAHFSMEQVSDYWMNVHQRNGWNNNNGEIRSYVNAKEGRWTTSNVYIGAFDFPNAFWDGNDMHFGNGTGDIIRSQPYTSLDICAHEMGHAITQTTSDLVYQWESGALNEGFSDIWAACITNYAKLRFSNLGSELTWRIAEKSENINQTNKGFRDMSDPGMFEDPSTYGNIYWKPSEYRLCRQFIDNNDNCGVHTNSAVLNKWFFLITQGENSYNSFGWFYNITGLGFAISQKIAYLTTLNLTPNASYATARAVSINAATTLYGANSTEVQTVKDAWIAVNVASGVHNMSNTSVFTTNNFTSVALDKNGDIWAGTNYNGLYRYSNGIWEKRTEVPNVRINDIKADKAGNIWIAQSGTQPGGSQALSGGVNYLRDPFGANDNTFYTIGAQQNVPSRNARCMFIDTTRTVDGTNPAAWVATLAYITSGNSSSGMLGQGLYNASPNFHKISGGLNIASNTAGVSTVGGNASEVWTFAQANNGINQLLTYNAGSAAFITAYDHNTTPIIPSGFNARSIYGDSKKRIWIPLADNGLLVYDEHHNWHYINFPEVFPAGTQASFNAICGTKSGDVYIGTNKGIVFFERGDGMPDKIDNPKNYKLYNNNNGLPSNQINALAYDTSRFKLIVASDSGVVFYEPFCLSPYCKLFTTHADISTETQRSGNWSDPTMWSENKIPDSLTVVTITHSVVVDINAKCKELKVLQNATVTVNPGINLTLYPDKPPVIIGAQRGNAIKKED